jgi:predicted AlkP superfamily phosphohydrolase/phosphomutase
VAPQVEPARILAKGEYVSKAREVKIASPVVGGTPRHYNFPVREPGCAILNPSSTVHTSVRLTIILIVAGFGASLCAAAPAAPPRVVVLGFDGADPKLVEQLMQEGKLPNLSKLAHEGSYSRLATTNPPQTPVSWSTFSTGINPGRTEIFDFLKRIDGTYVPEFAMATESRKPFLMGSRTPLVAGSAVGLALLLAGGAAAWLARRARRFVAIGTVLLAVAGGTGAGWVARTKLPAEVPDAINHRKGTTLWGWASLHGVRSRVLHVPNTFPAEPMSGGAMLSGLGVPDLRGRIGSPAFYSSDAALKSRLEENQFSIEFVQLDSDRGHLETHVVGPYNKPFFDYRVDDALAVLPQGADRSAARKQAEKDLEDRGIARRIDLPMELEVGDTSLKVRVSGHEQTLAPGEWSDWFVLDFPVNWLVDHVGGIRGMARFKLLSLKPHVQLYLSPINFHPDFEPIPFSSPKGFAASLVPSIGLFKTLGWPIDTWTPSAGLGDDNLFLEDMDFTVRKQEAMMDRLLKSGEDRLYVQVYDFPDRIGHLWWRMLDPKHPLYDPVEAARFGSEMEKAYIRMDSIVGRARAMLPPETLLMVCSDHGFASFRRGMNYNTWLVRNGWMILKEGPGGTRSLEDLFDRGETGEFFKFVDWSRTRAYAMGLGTIYVNLAGREPRGSVAPGQEYEAVRQGVIDGLQSYVDPDTGEHPVLRVYRREEMYQGFDPALIPDLRAANSEHYRVGWQTALGEVPPNTVEDNRKLWSGDHCSVDPSLVPGILFSSRRLARDNPGIQDIFPSVLKVLELPPVEGIDGRSFF